MEVSQALGILRMLSCGIDPYTGEKFQPASPYQQADTVRALFIAIGTLETNERRARPQGPSLLNAGKPWAADEDSKLLTAFDAGRSIKDIAAGHGRTIGSIQARLVKHGKITLPPVKGREAARELSGVAK